MSSFTLSSSASMSIGMSSASDEEGMSIFDKSSPTGYPETYSRQSIESEFSKRVPGFHPSAHLKQNENLKQLTINKLHYERVGFVGREREIETLQNCLDNMTSREQEANERSNNELVFIKGYSGVGKSSLAQGLEKSVTAMENGLFVKGKFDLNDSDEPYSGIASAFGQICVALRVKQVQEEGEEEKREFSNTIGRELSSELGSDVHLLSKLIPELEALLPPKRRLSTNSEPESLEFDAGQERWKYIFRLFTRVLCSVFSPLVLLFDDLQWADVSSLEVIDYLISDSLNPYPLMIVGCYRSNEVDDNHILSSMESELVEKKDQFKFNITDIELKSFQIDDVNRIIMALLAIDDEEKTKGLAEVCYKRTVGNPHFLFEFVTMLDEEGLIRFNLGLLQWVFDKAAIEKATQSTANVVDLLQARMRKLGPNVQLLLEYAACLGSSFKTSILELIWARHTDVPTRFGTEPGDLNQLLEVLERGNYIEGCGPSVFRFVHDKIQEAALALGRAAEPSFQYEIGSILYHCLEAEDLNDCLFDMVDLINKGRVTRRPELAELNLKAAAMARSISAFHSSAKYVSHGIKLLPSDKWESYRTLTLRLYTIGIEMELAIGGTETMEQYGEEILSQKDCTVLERLPLYMAKSYKLSTMELKYDEAITYCLAVLKEMGHNLLVMTRFMMPVQAISSLLKTVRRAKNTPKETFECPKLMLDPNKKAAMLFLNRLFYASYLGKNDYLLILSTTKMIQMTLNDGVGIISGPAYASLGLLTAAVLGDYDTASFFAETANMIQQSIRSKFYQSITTHTVSFAVLPWTQPLQSQLVPFMDAYNAGMRSGNTAYAMWALTMHHVFAPFQLGKSLRSIDESCPLVVDQSEEVKQEDQALFVKIFSQMIKNLIGESEETILLKGSSFNCETFVLKASNHIGVFEFSRLSLFVFFGDFEAAVELDLTKGEYFQEAFPALFLCMIETFFRGVALYAMARQTRKRQYIKRAKKLKRVVEKWMQNANPNVQHYYCLLNAEQAAFDNKCKLAKSFYIEAIKVAARTGQMHLAGLANERFADFLREDVKDEEEATYHITEAIKFYKNWGAEAKVRLLEKTIQSRVT